MKDYTLKKKFRFEAAHRLAHGYKGKCSNIHGHSWNGELEITTHAVDEQGLALDFGILGDFLKGIEREFDHKLLLSKKDEAFVLALTDMTDLVLMHANPTSETIAQYIYRSFAEWERNNEQYGITSFKVHIAETCTCCCTYTEK